MASETPQTAEKAPQTKPKVVEITRKPDATGIAVGLRPQRMRRLLLALSFVLLVALPVALGSVYYGFIASDRYVSGAGFAVRGVSAGGGLDGIGALTGLASSGSTTSDSYIILKYLKSRDIVDRLQADIDLRQAFSAGEIDRLSRMDSALPIEDFVLYWGKMISTTFDATSGVVTFEIEAYTAQQAEQIATLVLQYTQDLVNGLSETAREDSVRFAASEVVRAEARMREALASQRAFREQEQSLNPAATAQIDIELLGALQARLIDIRARMSAISGSVDADAPSMSALRRQAEALEAQIAERSAGIGGNLQDGGVSTGMSNLLAVYETLEVEKNFAQQAYASALSSLEQARVDADRQQRYLAVYSLPALPQAAIYPRRTLNVVVLALIAFALWGIGTLIVYSVRDHLS